MDGHRQNPKNGGSFLCTGAGVAKRKGRRHTDEIYMGSSHLGSEGGKYRRAEQWPLQCEECSYGWRGVSWGSP